MGDGHCVWTEEGLECGVGCVQGGCRVGIGSSGRCEQEIDEVRVVPGRTSDCSLASHGAQGSPARLDRALALTDSARQLSLSLTKCFLALSQGTFSPPLSLSISEPVSTMNKKDKRLHAESIKCGYQRRTTRGKGGQGEGFFFGLRSGWVVRKEARRTEVAISRCYKTFGKRGDYTRWTKAREHCFSSDKVRLHRQEEGVVDSGASQTSRNDV